MEYDPASPTDEPEDNSMSIDLSSIPLPRALSSSKSNGSIAKIHDIPLPAIPMPTVFNSNSENKFSQVFTDGPTEIPTKLDMSDVAGGPLKFSLKLSSKPHTGTEVPTEASGVFESSKDNKPDEPRSMPKLQAMMKRSKPYQLPVGVLPSKSKLPPSEVKTELFLPKESDIMANPTLDQLKSVPFISNSNSLSNHLRVQTTDTNEMLSNAIREINALNNFAQMASAGSFQPTITPHITLKPIGGSKPTKKQLIKLQGLKEHLIQTPPIPPVSMQYVNPQKFRSAQMIATPLIANPALAAQSQQIDDQSKGKDSRRRSRSRSRRHSRSRKRSHSRRRSSGRYRSRHRRSSSSSESPKPRSNHKESRTRKSSKDRHRSSHHESDHGRLHEKRPRREDRETKNTDSEQKHGKSHRARSSSEEDDPCKKKSRACSDVVNTAEFENDDKCDKQQKCGQISKASHRHRNYRCADKRSSNSNRDSVLNPLTSPKSKIMALVDDNIDNSVTLNMSDEPKKSKNFMRESRKKKPKSYQRSSDSSSGSDTSGSSDSSIKKDAKRVPAFQKTKVQSKHRSPSSSDSSSSSYANSPCNNHVSEFSKVPTSEASRTEKNPEACTSESLHTQKSVNIDIVPLGLHEISTGTAVSHPLDSDMELDSDIDFDCNCLDNFEIDDEQKSCEGGDLLNTVSNLGSISLSKNNCSIPISDVEFTLQVTDRHELKLEKSEIEATATHPTKQEVQNATNEPKYDLRKRKMKHQPFRSFPNPFKSQTESSDYSIKLNHIFASYPEVPTPQYIHILQNDYSFLEGNSQHANNTKQLTGSDRLVGTQESRTDVLHYEMRQWICDCSVPEDTYPDVFACGPGCINRALNIECGKLCPAREFCSNRQFQLRLYAQSEPFYAGKYKGWGLRATGLIEKDSFVIEYAGEVIDFCEFRRRVRRYERLGHAHHYFMALEPDRFIDAGNKGNWARFVNHSCEPNCVTQKWSVDGRICIGFFAKENITAGEELTIDYQFVQYGASEQKCYCGTRTCSGILGATSRHLQEKVRLKDTTVVERRILQLLQLDSFQHAEDITLLLQVMVQECLTRYTRLQLLERLAATENDACLKLFRQYNGLDMLAAFMCDTSAKDWELKKLILFCLDRIPVSEQTQVQSNSRLMDIVAQWTVNPEHCRARQLQLQQEQQQTCINESSSDSSITKVVASESDSEFNLTSQILGNDPPESVLTDEIVAETTVLGPPSPTSTPLMNEAVHYNASNLFTHSPDQDDDCSPNVLIDSETGELEITDPSVALATSSMVTTTTTRTSVGNDGSDQLLVSQIKEQIEQIEEIKKLALEIHEKWSKLPKENYRIPRLERQETEKILHVAHPVGSTLVSWGAEHEEKSDPHLKTWTRGASTKSNRNKSYTIRRDTSEKHENKSSKPADKSSVLAKAERRMLFEAQVRAEEEKVATKFGPNDNLTDSELSSENTDKNSLNKIEELLLYALLSECGQDKSTITELISNSDKELEHMPVVAALLKALPTIINNNNINLNESSFISSLSKELKRYAANGESVNELPSGWQSATDTSGRVYYYNIETKAVQWEKPELKSNNNFNQHQTDNDLSVTDEEEKKKQFTREVGNFILHLLKPYRLPNCLTGRIESNNDLIHITKKFTFMFVCKETKPLKSSKYLTLSKSMQDRIRLTVTRYMTSRGPIYKRRSKTVVTTDHAHRD